MADKQVWITFKVTPGVKKTLAAIAKAKDQSLGGFIRSLCRKALEGQNGHK